MLGRSPSIQGALAVILATGCAGRSSLPAPARAQDKAAGADRAGSFLIARKPSDGTSLSLAILHTATTAGADQLRDEVGLARRSVEHILAYRAGNDGIAGTGDDERFDNLAELDAVPFVGPAAYDLLLAHANAAYQKTLPQVEALVKLVDAMRARSSWVDHFGFDAYATKRALAPLLLAGTCSWVRESKKPAARSWPPLRR